MPTIKVAVIHAGPVLKDADAGKAVPALQAQVHDDFAPAWGVDADLVFIPRGAAPPAGAWWLTILDNSDQAGALGYHDLTDQGLPLGKVFAGTDIQFGSEWTVTASHQVLEMLGDTGINLAAYLDQPNGGMRMYAYEVCDACEADQFAYTIDGVLGTDFVYPAWVEAFRKGRSTPIDRQG